VIYCWACWLNQYSFCLLFGKCQFGIWTGTSAVLTEGSYGFSQSLQANCGIVSQSIQQLLMFSSFPPIMYSLLSYRQRCIFWVTLRVVRYTQKCFSTTNTKLNNNNNNNLASACNYVTELLIVLCKLLLSIYNLFTVTVFNHVVVQCICMNLPNDRVLVYTSWRDFLCIRSVQQKSSGLIFRTSRWGSHVTYSTSRFSFPIFVNSWRFSVFHSLQSITPRIY
jgi:hypothetical protein